MEKKILILFFFLLAVGIFLRTANLNWGLSQVENEKNLTPQTGQELPHGDEFTHLYNTYYFYGNHDIQYDTGYVKGLGFQTFIFLRILMAELSIKNVLLIGRILIAIYSTLTLVLVYFISKLFLEKTRDRLIAVAIFSFSAVSVAFSHVFLSDIANIFFFYLSIFSFLLFEQSQKIKFALLTTAAIALALSLKTSIILLVVFFGIFIISKHTLKTKLSMGAFLVPLLIFIFLLGNGFGYSIAQFEGNAHRVSTNVIGLQFEASRLLYYLFAFDLAFSSILLIFFMFGLKQYFGKKHTRGENIIFAMFTAYFLLSVIALQNTGTRYILQLIPIMAIITAYGFSKINDLRIKPTIKKAIAVALIAGIFLQFLTSFTLEYNFLNSTKQQATNWIEQNLGTKSEIYLYPGIGRPNNFPNVSRDRQKCMAKDYAVVSNANPKIKQVFFDEKTCSLTETFQENSYFLIKKIELKYFSPEYAFIQKHFGKYLFSFRLYKG